MKTWILAGAATAALISFSAPSTAATSPEVAYAGSTTAGPGVAAFYAVRHGAPLWLTGGPDSSAARELIGVLERAPLDGYAQGPAIARRATALIAGAANGNRADLLAADRLLSSGWAAYVQTLHRPTPGIVYADPRIAPHPRSSTDILLAAATAPSLAMHVRSVSDVNPFYAQIRDAAWAQMQTAGGQPDPRVLATLERARAIRGEGRYIVVDSSSARLWMVDNGRIAGSMKVIVGKPSTQTPMLASVIYYATLNPYWNVPKELIRTLTAPKVLDQGLSYLKRQGYQVLTGYGPDAELLDPSTIDWKAVEDGQTNIAVRQLPGPANSMGHIKFGFANEAGVYLHDSPEKQLFMSDDRDISHGCVRLQDAERLGRWLLGRDPSTDSSQPEQHVALPEPVPVYLTYLTAHVEDGQLTYADDIYGKDARYAEEMAALR